jgi:hypothetical protein
LQAFLSEGDNTKKFEQNKELISFIDVSNDENMITFTNDEPRWEDLFELFQEMNFKSIVSERGWKNFLSAFTFV